MKIRSNFNYHFYETFNSRNDKCYFMFLGSHHHERYY